MLAVSFGGLLHGSVPHMHDLEHGRGESAIWHDLHGSLRHEDKKALFMTLESILWLILAIISFGAHRLSSFEVAHEAAELRDPRSGPALRKGIHKYRRFG